MQLFRLIVLIFVFTMASHLQAKFQSFCVGKDVHKVALSPDGKLLATYEPGKIVWDVLADFEPGSIQVWNVRTGQLHSKCENKSNCANSLFFSSDGTMIFTAESNTIDCYKIKPGNISFEKRLTFRDTLDFWQQRKQTCPFDQNMSNIVEQINRLGLSTGISCNYKYTLQACAITPDALMAAVAYAENLSLFSYIDIANLGTDQILHRYKLDKKETILSINFSPNKSQLIIVVVNSCDHNFFPEYGFYIVDLASKQSSWFKQGYMEYANFIDETTILVVSLWGYVTFYELTLENLENNRVPNKNIF